VPEGLQAAAVAPFPKTSLQDESHMAISSSSATFTRFFVPDAIREDFWSYVDEKLNEGMFKDPDDGQELAQGFTSWEDFFESSFPYGSYHKGEYLAFNFRIDQRKVPPIVLKKYVREAVRKHRDENEGKWPARHEKIEIQENVRSWLLNRALFQPVACEVVWNTARKWLLVGTTSSKLLDVFLTHFEDMFHMYPVPLYHVHWALNLLPLDGRQKDHLGSMITVQSPLAMDEGRFLGYEFLTWLWFFVEHHGGRIEIPGKVAELHLGERFVLNKPGEGMERVVCTTQANSLHEARTGLRQGKMVHEIQLFLVVGDNEYTFTLDSALWTFKGLKTPRQARDSDQEDQDGEFLEKMFFLEEVFSVLDVLYTRFLSERLGPHWESDHLGLMVKWMEGGKPAGEEGPDTLAEADRAPF